MKCQPWWRRKCQRPELRIEWGVRWFCAWGSTPAAVCWPHGASTRCEMRPYREAHIYPAAADRLRPRESLDGHLAAFFRASQNWCVRRASLPISILALSVSFSPKVDDVGGVASTATTVQWRSVETHRKLPGIFGKEWPELWVVQATLPGPSDGSPGAQRAVVAARQPCAAAQGGGSSATRRQATHGRPLRIPLVWR